MKNYSLFISGNRTIVIQVWKYLSTSYIHGASAVVTVYIIQRYLIENELHENQPQQMSLNKQKYVSACLSFVKTFLKKEKNFWSEVLWSNETKI